MVAQTPIRHIIFWETVITTFRSIYIYFFNTLRFLADVCTKLQKMHFLDNLRTLSDLNWTRTQNHLVRKRRLNHLAKLVKWLNVRLQTKWFWVRVQLQSLKLEISCLLRARRFLTFRQLQSVDSLWHAGWIIALSPSEWCVPQRLRLSKVGFQ